MRTRKLGKYGPDVSVLGFGAWPIAGKLGPVEEHDAVAAIQRAVDGRRDAHRYGGGDMAAVSLRSLSRKPSVSGATRFSSLRK